MGFAVPAAWVYCEDVTICVRNSHCNHYLVAQENERCLARLSDRGVKENRTSEA